MYLPYYKYRTYKNKRITGKNKRMAGTTMAELPAGLWITFVGICLPLLCLVLTAVRFALFWEAAREAADAAAQAQYYIDPSSNGASTTSNGAVSLAQNTAVRVASMFSGITVTQDDVQCWIVTTPLANASAVGTNNSQSSTAYGPNKCLSSPADPSQNLYQIRVDVNGTLKPMITMSGGFLGTIPGLGAPLQMKISMFRVFENPQGLNQYSIGGG